MIQVSDVSLRFSDKKLYEDVNLKFTKGNCYGIIGANGAGKSTFLKILTGEIEPTTGEVFISENERMSVLEQNQEKYNEYTVLNTVLSGHKRLYQIMLEKDALYSKPDFSEEDGIKAGELENEYMELGGYEAESDAENLLNGLGIDSSYHYMLMKDLDAKLKVKVLLAQSLFGNPDILVLDEPTNNLDAKTVRWLENFLLDFENLVIVVSHNRHFLNKICTNICDVDYGKINMFVGNYDFWYETNQLLQRQAREQNKKMEARAEELKEFIARFSANASKSRQATSRKKELEKLTLNDIVPSSRKYPYVDFKPERDIGNEVLMVENLTKPGFFENVSFTILKDQKVAFLSDNSLLLSKFFDILSGKDTDYTGEIKWGKTITTSYMPQNYNEFFDNCDLNLVEWLSQFSKEHEQSFLRGWLGRMLFSGEEALKKAKVLSGGEKVRCMLAKTMLTSGNVLMFDEPTNHLDLESIQSLNKGMQNFKGVILFSSHDHELMQTVANRIIVINKTKEFDKPCTYEEYLDTI
ncbi:MAG: ATP-binding cassette domain-containing protein [Clostridiales bacterium]|nr:ATP-binding cassette domain-containing protein [Candidatus Apopatousia equi]